MLKVIIKSFRLSVDMLSGLRLNVMAPMVLFHPLPTLVSIEIEIFDEKLFFLLVKQIQNLKRIVEQKNAD
jgi:hypothetical protein